MSGLTHHRLSLITVMTALMIIGSGCESNNSSSTSNVTSTGSTATVSSLPHTGKLLVSWAVNHEKSVNSSGGGYKVYYSTSATITGSTPFVSIPYTSPTWTLLTGLSTGTYFINVIAYSALNTSGSTATQITAAVP